MQTTLDSIMECPLTRLIFVGLILYLLKPHLSGYFEEFKGLKKVKSNKSKAVFAFFYAPWCGHCKNAKPAFKQLQKKSKSSPVTVIDINCDDNKEMAVTHKIDGFPTFRLYPDGLNNRNHFKEYNGDRSLQSLDNFLQSYY
jgi:protein disulfide-isomerase-like protein